MSGRGTTKAGSYGGRRFREKQKITTKQQAQLAKDIKKAQRAVPKTMKIREDLPAPANFPNKGNVLNAPLGRGGVGLAPAMYQDFDAEEIPFVGKKPFTPYTQSRDQRALDIQRTINTMPLRQDAQYLSLIRQEVEQRHREELYPDLEFEDYAEQEDIEDMSAHAEAGTIVDEETGEIEYGTAVPDFSGFNEVDELAFDPFTEDPIDEEYVSSDEDDAEVIAFGKALDRAGEKKNLAEEIARRKAERQRKNMSLPAGDKARPPNGFFDPKVDFQAEDDSGAGRRTKISAPDRPISYIRGLAPQDKYGTKYPIEQYKFKKASKKEGGGMKLDLGAKGNLKPTDEYIKLQEGRILDRRLGMAGRDIETGTRSRVKLETTKIPKREYDLGEGVKRDPKTRKVLTDKKGNPKMENKKLTIAPYQKPVEELWGVDRKGMSRDEDNPPTRDPYEGRRAIAKEPGKRATKRREADTKHALYVKEQIKKDPNYLPRGFDPFDYGAGVSVFDRKKPKQATTQAQELNPIQNTTMSETQQLEFGDIGEDEYEALQDYEPQPIQRRNPITNPPMSSVNAQNAPTPMNTTSGSSMRAPPGISVPAGSTLSLDDFAKANRNIRALSSSFKGESIPPQPSLNLPPGINLFDDIGPTYSPDSP